jgi:hypothetical protein
MLTAIIGHLLAVCIGLSLGLVGSGGSVLAVPVLVYVMAVPSKAAIAMTLAIVGTVSAIGVIPHWLQGNVNLKTAIAFTPPAMVGAYLGARIAGLPFITDTFQLVSFGIVVAIASLFMIGKNHRTIPVPKDIEELDKSHQKHGHKLRWLAVPLEGLGVGILTGFVGVGGGFMIIPALVLLGGIPMKEAIGTSLLIIVFKSATGFVGYLSQVELDLNLMVTFTLAAAFGTVGGAYLTKHIEAKHLEKGFGYFVLAVAIFVLIRR